MMEEWTDAELALIEASKAYFEAIAAVTVEGGRVQEAIMAAMPAEVREQIPGASMADALKDIS